MKSGPTLKGCTTRPRARKAAMIPRVTVVLPTPLWVPAIRKAGMRLSEAQGILDWLIVLGPLDLL